MIAGFISSCKYFKDLESNRGHAGAPVAAGTPDFANDVHSDIIVFDIARLSSVFPFTPMNDMLPKMKNSSAL